MTSTDHRKTNTVQKGITLFVGCTVDGDTIQGHKFILTSASTICISNLTRAFQNKLGILIKDDRILGSETDPGCIKITQHPDSNPYPDPKSYRDPTSGIRDPK